MTDRAEHHEGEEAREIRDRQVAEILQELRVAITGGQILFGFLLTVPFAQGWAKTDDLQRTLFLVSYANAAAIAGLVFLMTAMVSATLLVTDFVFSRATAVVATVAVGLVMLTLWFAVPLSRYARE
jgi:fatty acid desaturase